MSAGGAMERWRELEDDASRATIILQKLTSKKEELKESLPRGTEPMPRRRAVPRRAGAGVQPLAPHAAAAGWAWAAAAVPAVVE